MNGTSKKIIAVFCCLIIAVGAVVGGIFGARAVERNKRAANERRAIVERQEAVVAVENGVLASVNEKWATDLSSEELADLEDVGDFMLARGWANLIADTLYASTLQTAKIRRLADAIASKDGQKLFADFEENAGLLVPLLKDIDFKSEDVSSLVCALLDSLVDNSATMLGEVRDNLLPYMSAGKTSENAKKVIATISAELEYVTFTAQEKADMKTKLAEARVGIEALVGFAYNTSMESLLVIFDGDGALVDITDTEVKTVVSTVLSGTRELKTKMTAENVEKLNAAISALTQKFVGNAVTSKVFSQLVNWAKFAYVLTDSVPYFCDLLVSAGDVVDTEFLEFVFAYNDEKEYSTTEQTVANISVLSARLAEVVFDGVGQAEFEEFLQKLATQATTDYRRALPIVLVDILVNLTSATMDAEGNVPMHTDIMTEEVAKDTFAFLVTSLMLPTFERTYYDYTEGNATLDSLRIAANACKFDNIDIENSPYDRETNTKAWFEYYLTSAKNKLAEIATRIAPVLKADVSAYLGDYYKEDSALKAQIEAHAERELIHSVSPLPDGATDEQQAEYDAKISARDSKITEYVDSAKSARVYGLAYIIAILLGQATL